MAATMRSHGNQYNYSRYQKFRPQQSGATRAIALSTITCRYCRKPRHIERDCRSKRYDQRNWGRRFHPQANTTSISDIDEATSANDDEDSSFIQAFTCHLQMEEMSYEGEANIQSFMAGLQTFTGNLWFFDIGATHHLTDNRECLHNYVTLPKPLEKVL